jgi:hypothetical protein
MQDTYLTKNKTKKNQSHTIAHRVLKRKQITFRMSANHALKAKEKTDLYIDGM